jgi:addiction module HigA family antidote
MMNPPHPGETLRDDVLPALGLTVTDAAQALGVTRTALSRVLNGKAGISPEMALRLEAWLGVEHGGRAEVWLRMQVTYDLAQVAKKSKAVLKKIIALDDARFALEA